MDIFTLLGCKNSIRKSGLNLIYAIKKSILLFFITTYDLVSHGAVTGQECYGYYDNTTQVGYGPVYQNSCIHSDSNSYSGGDTVWYNYTLASAGTIFDENTSLSDPANNMDNATESVCPKGWTLPSTKQLDNQRDIVNFTPVLGGFYSNGMWYEGATYGHWWGSEAYISIRRYYLSYNGSALSTYNNGNRRSGLYIRCVSEEKTVTDLTYMQDMTPTLADAEAFI